MCSFTGYSLSQREFSSLDKYKIGGLRTSTCKTFKTRPFQLTINKQAVGGEDPRNVHISLSYSKLLASISLSLSLSLSLSQAGVEERKMEFRK
jgi:outer membrane usher protein FimD/PapC